MISWFIFKFTVVSVHTELVTECSFFVNSLSPRLDCTMETGSDFLLHPFITKGRNSI